MNPALAKVFPQFDSTINANLYSDEKIKSMVLKYLANALNGTVTDAGELVVCGDHKTVLNHVRRLQPLIESLYNSIPKVTEAFRNNVSLYLPYATRKQIEEIKTIAEKVKAMNAVMDNFQYNTELGALNSVKNERSDQFAKNKTAWEQKVGYRRTK